MPGQEKPRPPSFFARQDKLLHFVCNQVAYLKRLPVICHLMKPYQLAIFASGSGTNAEAIIRYFQEHPTVAVRAIFSNNPEAFALRRAETFQLEARVFNRQQFLEPAFGEHLAAEGFTHLVLAGFLWLLPPTLLRVFPHHIVNIHPSLLPKFGGQGMYGMRVHEAVRKSGDSQTGITIHEVNEQYDAGKILFQARCAVLPGDQPEDIARRVHTLEHRYYPRVIEQWVLQVPVTPSA